MARLEPGNDPETAPLPPEARADHSPAPTDPAAAFRQRANDHPPPEEEREIWAGRTSWKHFAPRLSLWLFGNIAVCILMARIAGEIEGFESKYVFGITVALVLVSGLVIPGRVVLRIFGERYRLTSQRLFITRGILSQTIDQTELVRIDDVRIRKTLVDRLLGLGTVSIVSTDATDSETTMEGIADAEGVAEAIRTHVRAMRQKSLYIESI